MIRKRWNDGKYAVNVRKFEDGQISVGFWKVDKNGKLHDIRYKDLPKYVVAKIEEFEKEVGK
ncbi:hypothetical protein CWR48_13875 [Oceanobacillus arenosus]|uniref:Uncharacterized protein n=1 Tax=Oceanobacillus arenosus TaxID=1229153 RepID=A0A3D8PQN8_9BACI|nr:hypothetical protein [Oceanobacillus arenosus]RDW17601.1 hypothetical protein CWR48_13875 [Oceanobacillus arenosus]